MADRKLALLMLGVVLGNPARAWASVPSTALLVAEGCLSQAGFTTNHFVDVDRAMDADQYQLALDLLGSLRTTARVARDDSLQQEAVERTREVRQLLSAFNKVREHAETLKASPEDQRANQEMGLFYCTLKADWDRGIRCLAKGANDTLRELAMKDLEALAAPEARLELASRWWDYADAQRADERHPFELRGRHWYLQARPMLSLTARVEAERRLSRISLHADRVVIWN